MNDIALVTGSGRGIGAVIAQYLASLGIQVAVNYRKSREKALKVVETIREQGGYAKAFQADITEAKQVKGLIEDVTSSFGGLNIIITNAGYYLYRPLLQMPPEEWDKLIRINLYGTYYCIYYGFPALRACGGGRIITISSSGAQNLLADSKRIAYRIAKTGVIQLTRAFAVELAASSITVNSISPGIIDNGAYSDEYLDKIQSKIPAGRIGKPKDMFQAIDFFLAKESEYVTGTNIEVAGGWNL